MNDKPLERASLYIDGNNFYHFVKGCVAAPGALSYAKLSKKLIGARTWVSTKYYIGALNQDWSPKLYAAQRSFLTEMRADDGRISVHLGRLERRVEINPLSAQLIAYLDDPSTVLPVKAAADVRQLAETHAQVETLKEKAVDIMLAHDMLEGAIGDEYDCAFLLSADGDFTPIVESVRRKGKKVFVASPVPGYSSQLARVASAFIKLESPWLKDCYR
jgi:uncharacterized LabA/DUF88 family protein